MLAAALVAGCAEAGATKPQTSAVSPEGSVSVTPFARSASPTASTTAASSDAPAASAPSATPTGSASAEPTVAVPDVSSAPPPAPELPAVLPDVEVKNVGMHIGGGPNDNATKQPIRDAVKPHYDELRACYAKANKPGKEETFGVDILIPADGGRAKITKPRVSMKGEGLAPCLTAVFERVEFAKPPKGVAMTVSFSVQFKKK